MDNPQAAPVTRQDLKDLEERINLRIDRATHMLAFEAGIIQGWLEELLRQTE